jgi:predicted O-linked N-acetylglucosamine transferase (SPINDLY family)
MTTIPALLQAAVGRHQAGDVAAAARLYQAVLARDAGQPDALHLLGLLAHQSGNSALAIQLIGAALSRVRDFAAAWNNLGNAFKAVGRPDDADIACRRALVLEPAEGEALTSLGGQRLDADAPDLAARWLRRALAAVPAHAGALNNLGNVLQRAGAAVDARRAYRVAGTLAPFEARIVQNLATSEGGAVALNLSRRALRLDPGSAAVWSNLGNQLNEAGRLGPAIDAFRRALALDPALAEAASNLGIALSVTGRPSLAQRWYRRALAARPDFAAAHSNLLVCLAYDADCSEIERFAEARRWGERQGAALRPLIRAHENARDPERRLRVGYLSADFRRHPVAYNMAELIAAHDRRAFEVVGYAEVRAPDGMTARIRESCDLWRSTPGVGDVDLAAMIRADRIDILVVLCGHTSGNRIRVAAAKPAPVVASYGDLGTSGLDTVDYWMTDAVLTPLDTPERFTEALVRLPVFEVHRRPEGAPDPAPPPSLGTGHVTFGSSNNPAKLSQATLDAWAGVLRAVPGSRLLLRYFEVFETPQVQAQYRQFFQARGIAPDRLAFAGGTPERAHYLGLLDAIDVALDPFPFNGCTTSFEALWMGVPVVTLAGTRFVGRVGAGILGRIGLEDLVATSIDDYVARARAIALDLPRRQALRTGLRDRLARSPLCDPASHARSVEAAYRTMWRRWCTGEAPCPI